MTTTIATAVGCAPPGPVSGSSFAVHRNRSLWLPVAGALIVPLALGLKPALLGPVVPVLGDLLFLLLLWIPVYSIFRSVYDWSAGEGALVVCLLRRIRPLPPGLVYGSDAGQPSFPTVTVSLIAANTLLYFVLPEKAVEAGMFPPYGEPTLPNLFFTTFSCAFLHADLDHLLGNMVFLWAFGSTVETRIGAARFAWVYVVCIFVSNLADVALLNFQADRLDSLQVIGTYHSLGASGAIAGLMGVFVVRCFFARVTLSLPIFTLPVLSIPIRVQGVLLVGLFFALDVSGSAAQLDQEAGEVDYWAHVGGYLCGFALAYLLNLHVAASEEAVRVKAERCRQQEFGAGGAAKVYAEILERDPENEEALAYLLQNHSAFDKEKARDFFVRLVKRHAVGDFHAAVDLIGEHFPEHVTSLSEVLLLKFGLYFLAAEDLRKARLCLETAAGREGPWQAKAMLYLADVYREMGVPAHAECLLREVTDRFAGTDFSEAAFRRLEVGQEIMRSRPAPT